MGWNIGCPINTLRTSKETANKCIEFWDNEGICTSYSEKHGFEPDYDAAEHMDMFANYALPNIMLNSPVAWLLEDVKTEGRVCYSSSEGDNNGCHWGYEFRHLTINFLKGKIVWDYWS